MKPNHADHKDFEYYIFIPNEATIGGTNLWRKNKQNQSFPKEGKKKVLATMESSLIYLQKFLSF